MEERIAQNILYNLLEIMEVYSPEVEYPSILGVISEIQGSGRFSHLEGCSEDRNQVCKWCSLFLVTLDVSSVVTVFNTLRSSMYMCPSH